ncbi:LytR/AlgR family response regulator transcription factor [Salininema proteolyticum]|uniref:LytR/AlgR family response regulator transcription factor n=1 Tax=Salininema proteolyticum TaxID=1607685 RepID=A0ABV8TTT2_9ACTN
MRFLVVEDEAATRSEMLHHLSRAAPDAELTEASSGDEAVRLIATGEFDAAFLDISMPGVSGMDLARLLSRMEKRPAIVFVTAYDSHAVDAFALGAVDYILKPIRPERVSEAVRRISAPASGPSIEADAAIEVELGGETVFLSREEVAYVQAHGDYVRLHTAAGSHLLRQTMTELERSWAAAGFVRAHRSFLVNLAHVRQLNASTKSGLVAVTDVGGVPVSRRHARLLRERLLDAARESLCGGA